MSALSTTSQTHIPPVWLLLLLFPFPWFACALLYLLSVSFCSVYPSMSFVSYASLLGLICREYRLSVYTFCFFFFAYIFLVFYIFQMSSDYADAVTFISAAYLAWFFEIFIFFTTYIAYPYSVRQVRVQVFKYVTAPASFAGADFVCTRPAFAFIIFSLQISFDVKYV